MLATLGNPVMRPSMTEGSVLPILFKNAQWSTLGNTSAAFRDGTNFDASIIGEGRFSEVVTAASLGIADWPTPNVFDVRAWGIDMWGATQVQWDLGTPSPGDVRYFRWYYQDTVPNTVTPDGAIGDIEHGCETSDANTGGGDGFNPIHVPLQDGTWFPQYREISSGYFYATHTTTFAKATTFREEWRIAYGVGEYTVQQRLYDGAGVKVFDSADGGADEADFYQISPAHNPALTLDAATFTLADFGDHRWFRMGCNDPTSNFPVSTIAAGDGWARFGAAAVSFDTWCGPYIEGNG